MSTFGTTKNHGSAPGIQQGANRPAEAHDQHAAAATKFKPGRAFRLGNSAVSLLLRTGVPMGPMRLLTVPGRKSGLPRTTPVAVSEYDGDYWVFSPYGNVDWVRNLRAAGQGTFRHGRWVEVLFAREVTATEAAPMLKRSLGHGYVPGVVRAQFAIPLDAPLAEWEREAPRHPTFRLSPTPFD